MLRNGPVDWGRIDLVIFDMDGTLYEQRRLRALMLFQIVAWVARTGDLALPKILREFRRVREGLADQLADSVTQRQFAITAERLSGSAAQVELLVEEWMQRRPLAFLPACRVRGVEALFSALTAAEKRIAILSDYPADAKLAALGLRADMVVCATDPEVDRLKPHPAGLRRILTHMGVRADRALLVGDRFDRDWETARRLDMRALIRSPRSHPLADTFRCFTDMPFADLLRDVADRSGSTAGMEQAMAAGGWDGAPASPGC